MSKTPTKYEKPKRHPKHLSDSRSGHGVKLMSTWLSDANCSQKRKTMPRECNRRDRRNLRFWVSHMSKKKRNASEKQERLAVRKTLHKQKQTLSPTQTVVIRPRTNGRERSRGHYQEPWKSFLLVTTSWLLQLHFTQNFTKEHFVASAASLQVRMLCCTSRPMAISESICKIHIVINY